MESKGPSIYAVRTLLNAFLINILVSCKLVVNVARLYFTHIVAGVALYPNDMK